MKIIPLTEKTARPNGNFKKKLGTSLHVKPYGLLCFPKNMHKKEFASKIKVKQHKIIKVKLTHLD